MLFIHGLLDIDTLNVGGSADTTGRVEMGDVTPQQ